MDVSLWTCFIRLAEAEGEIREALVAAESEGWSLAVGVGIRPTFRKRKSRVSWPEGLRLLRRERGND